MLMLYVYAYVLCFMFMLMFYAYVYVLCLCLCLCFMFMLMFMFYVCSIFLFKHIIFQDILNNNLHSDITIAILLLFIYYNGRVKNRNQDISASAM